MNMKEYQNIAVDELCKKAKELLRLDGTQRMVFKAPTGSGKTIMAAEFLKQLSEDPQVRDFSCIWAAPRDLHLQSKKKLDRYYADSRALDCVEFDDLTDNQIADEQILFFNWESVRQANNIIIRENERDKSLGKVLENTHEAGRAIILIIDESHYHITDIVVNLINSISPKLIIDISATPYFRTSDGQVNVQLQHVKDEGMIKKSVVINEGFNNLFENGKLNTPLSASADKIVLETALKKRHQLADEFRAMGAEVNPLLCIQLPDRGTGDDDNIRRMVEQTLSEHNITAQNGKFAVYLSGEKVNHENIANNNNEVEVLLFKQAIALGWDCPRAHILALFRNWQNITFSVQTLGRIMRMPEPNTGHYDNDMLNHGYVYTNLPEMEIHEEVAGGYTHIYTSDRDGDYQPLKLLSHHRLRQREKTRISPKFRELFFHAAQEYNLPDKLNLRAPKVSKKYISGYIADSVDAIVGQTIHGNENFDVGNKEDLQKLFNNFVRNNLSPYYPEDRSIGNVKEAIYGFFDEPLFLAQPLNLVENFSEIINIVLSDDNRGHFAAVLDKAKKEYQKQTAQRQEPLQETKHWEVPVRVTFGENYRPEQVAKSIMKPFYVSDHQSRPEADFIEFLEGHKNVRWWYKNGEGESMYFAVPYTENGEESPFYVDFIVRLQDGRVGLFDTKSGMTIDTAKGKSDGLLAYIAEQNRNRPKTEKLFGGIVAQPRHSQVWRIYTGKGADLSSRNIDEWDYLNLD